MPTESTNTALNTTTTVTTERPAAKRAKPPGKISRTGQSDKIRAELNIEKWPAIWQPSKSKNKPAVRKLEREVQMADGTRATSRLEVGFTQLGTITTEDQKMFYALVKQWENSGKPAAQVFFSDRLLQRLLKKKWGTNVIEAITGSLRRLRTTPFTWINSYHHAATPKATFEEETFFTLLADLKIIRRKVDGHVTNQQGYFQFDKNILTNLLSNYTKPLFLEDLFRFESEIAQLIYVHVDLLLAAKTTYERRTRELFEDLGLSGDSYRYPSNRKQALLKAIKELEGARLSTGVLKGISLQKTADGKDYKIVFRKQPASVEELEALTPQEAATQTDNAAVVVHDYSKQQDPSMQQATELLDHFYQVFHGMPSRYPQAKEISQALSFIGQHGMQQAKHVVNFAYTAAAETKYLPQTFGGILQYASRALADFDRRQQQQQGSPHRPQPKPLTPAKTQHPARAEAERRLAALTPEQYAARFAAVKAELLRQIPFLAQHSKSSSKLQEQIIRQHVLRTLEGGAWTCYR